MGILQNVKDLVPKVKTQLTGLLHRGNAGRYEEQPVYQPEMYPEQPEEESTLQPADPFQRSTTRVPYRSRAMREQEEQQQAMQDTQPAYQPQPYQQQSYQQPQSAPRPGNVVNFPGLKEGSDGGVYAHVEYIVLLRSREECKDVIAYLKHNASVFVNMEFIPSDVERQRCVDVLSGAACTVGCRLSKISQRGMYLISSPSVMLVLDPALTSFNERRAASAQEAREPQRRQSRQQQNQQQYAQQAPYQQQPYQPQYRQQPEQAELYQDQPAEAPAASAFAGGSPTMRFAAQRNQPMNTSFGGVMAGGAVQPVSSYPNIQP